MSNQQIEQTVEQIITESKSLNEVLTKAKNIESLENKIRLYKFIAYGAEFISTLLYRILSLLKTLNKTHEQTVFNDVISLIKQLNYCTLFEDKLTFIVNVDLNSDDYDNIYKKYVEIWKKTDLLLLEVFEIYRECEYRYQMVKDRIERNGYSIYSIY
jgi:hypothetical protein